MELSTATVASFVGALPTAKRIVNISANTIGVTVDRPHGIGGSDAAAAVGLDPYKSRVRLWLELTGRVERQEAGEAAKWGRVIEPLLAAELRNYGYSVTGADPLQDGFRFGHLDGYVYGEGGQSIGIAELKTCSLRLAHAWDDDAIPAHYQVQGLHYLSLSEISEYVAYACLVGGQRFVMRRMERNDDLIAQLVAREEEFWHHVETDTQPPVDSATSDDLAILYPESTEETVTLDDAPQLIHNLRVARNWLKVAEGEVERFENAVKDRLGTAAIATLNGEKVVSWKAHETNRLDSTRLREERPDVYEQFVKVGKQRPFRVY